MKNSILKRAWFKLFGIQQQIDYFNGINNRLSVLEGSQEEILYSEYFHDITKDSDWYNYKNISPSGWAINYKGMWIIYNILTKTHPHNILEFGLGQSSKLIHQYADHFSETTAITYEHDTNWASFFLKDVEGKYHVNIHYAEIEKTIYKGFETLSYKDNCKELKNSKFDFILVDGPFGSDHYSRSQILHIVPYCLNKSFCILIDDAERKGEQETINELSRIFNDNHINYCYASFCSTKSIALFCSTNFQFLTTV